MGFRLASKAKTESSRGEMKNHRIVLARHWVLAGICGGYIELDVFGVNMNTQDR